MPTEIKAGKTRKREDADIHVDPENEKWLIKKGKWWYGLVDWTGLKGEKQITAWRKTRIKWWPPRNYSGGFDYRKSPDWVRWRGYYGEFRVTVDGWLEYTGNAPASVVLEIAASGTGLEELRRARMGPFQRIWSSVTRLGKKKN